MCPDKRGGLISGMGWPHFRGGVASLSLSTRRLAGYPPFSAEKLDHSLNNQIVHARYSFPSEYWGGVSADAMEMVRRLLTLDPEQRITVTEALAHPWLQDEEVLAKAHRLMEAHSPTPATIAVSPLCSMGRR